MPITREQLRDAKYIEYRCSVCGHSITEQLNLHAMSLHLQQTLRMQAVIDGDRVQYARRCKECLREGRHVQGLVRA